MSDKPRCSAMVWEGYGENRCDCAGTIQEDGEWWCKRHAPSKVAERKSAREKRWIAKSVERLRAREIECIQARIVSAVVGGDGIDITALNNLRAQYRALENSR